MVIFKKKIRLYFKFKNWKLDNNEREFINRVKIKKQANSISRDLILIQCVNDYFYFSLFANVVKKENKLNLSYFQGVSPNLFIIKQKYDCLYIFYLIGAFFNFYFINFKWKKLYNAIGIKKIYKLNSGSTLNTVKQLFKAFRIWYKVKSKNEILNLNYNNILIGDLIYDTYLRFRISATVNVSDPYLFYYIFSAIRVVESCERIVLINKVTKYFCSYTTYIQHGVPVRVFLKNHIPVYSSGNLQQLFKKLSLNDYLQTANHFNYYNDFLKITNKGECLSYSRRVLNSKFSGNIDSSISYMKKSAFDKDESSILMPEFDGVIFLHDFFDSPHIYSNLLFNDFYDWVVHTLELVTKHHLRVAVKPHPNQIIESQNILNKLKKEYTNIKWLDAELSNIVIFNSGIKFGISVYGTILHELAYFGINPICAGDNPHASFDFIHKPKNIQEYDYFILNYLNLKMPSNYKALVEIFFYMHNLHKKESYILNDTSFQYNKRVLTSDCLNSIQYI